MHIIDPCVTFVPECLELFTFFSFQSVLYYVTTTTFFQLPTCCYVQWCFPFSAFIGHYKWTIMVSLSVLLSDAKQNSKSAVSGLPTVDTTIIIFATTPPHHYNIIPAADTPTLYSSANSPCVNKDYTSSHSPTPEGRAMSLLSPSGQWGDRLINTRRGETGWGDGKHMLESHKRWLSAWEEESSRRSIFHLM